MDNFKDDSILSYPIKVVMMGNSFGKKERGEDDGGLLRDALSAFWSEFYDVQLAKTNASQWSGMTSRRKSGKQLQEFW